MVGSDSKQRILKKGVAKLESTKVAECLHCEIRRVHSRLPPSVVVFVLGVTLGIFFNLWGNSPYASYCPLLSDVVAWLEGYKTLYWRQRWITSSLDLVLGTRLNSELSCALWGCIVCGTALSMSHNTKFRSRFLLGLVHKATFGARPSLRQGSCFGETAVASAGHQGEQSRRLQGGPTLESLC